MTPHAIRSPRPGRVHVKVALLAALGLVLTTATPALATLGSISPRPAQPTTCDLVTLLVRGDMPDPCHHVIAAELKGPIELPTMGPIPTYEIQVRIIVQVPPPSLVPCPTVLEPYERGFDLGRLPFGQYFVRAVEYTVTWDSLAAPRDSSRLDANFDVSPTQDCPTPLGCYILDFAQGDVPSCNAVGLPGGTACLEIELQNEVPVGGIQTVLQIIDPRTPYPPLSSSLFQVSRVEVADRAAGFQVAWSSENSRTRILMFSTSGATIPAGRGKVLRVCYSIAPNAPPGAYPIAFGETIVPDPEGNALPPCPTFAPIVGRICVAGTGCDLNGDGASDILDIMRLVRCALGDSADTCPDSVLAKADCTADGSVDIRDVICCVRRILTGGGLGSGGGEPGDPTNATEIGFEGPVRWLSPVDGRAVLAIEPGDGFGGIQFEVDAAGAPARVRGLRLLGPAGYRLESYAAPDGRVARGMLFREGAAADGPIRVDVLLEPAGGTGTEGTITLSAAKSATQAAGAMATRYGAASATVTASDPPAAPAVLPARPNPFADETEIAYSLPSARTVSIRVYGATGRHVRTIEEGTRRAGVHRARWDGRDASGRLVGSGIYFIKFETGDVERTMRILRLR